MLGSVGSGISHLKNGLVCSAALASANANGCLSLAIGEVAATLSLVDTGARPSVGFQPSPTVAPSKEPEPNLANLGGWRGSNSCGEQVVQRCPNTAMMCRTVMIV